MLDESTSRPICRAESRLVVASSLGRWGFRVGANGYSVSLGVTKML